MANYAIKFPANAPAQTGFGRNGTFKACGLDVVTAGDFVHIANLTSKGVPASGHIALPQDPDTLRQLAATLEQIAADIGKPDKPQWQRMFPDFEPETMPPIPAEWVDISWRNDSCPGFQVIETKSGENSCLVKVWIDYKHESLREYPDGKRFTISFERWNGSEMVVNDYFESDYWQAIINQLPEILDNAESF